MGKSKKANYSRTAVQNDSGFLKGRVQGPKMHGRHWHAKATKKNFSAQSTATRSNIAISHRSTYAAAKKSLRMAAENRPRPTSKHALQKTKMRRTCLNADAKIKGKGGPHTSPTPEDMEPIVGKNCAVRYFYCPKSGKIYTGADAKEDYDADESCQAPAVDCSKMPRKCTKSQHQSKAQCAKYASCWGG